MIIAVGIIILNIVGVVWFGITIEHAVLLPLGYLIGISILAGVISEEAAFIVAIVVAVITIIAILIQIVAVIGDKKRDKKLEKEISEKQENSRAFLNALNNGDKTLALELIEKGVDVNYIGYISPLNKSLLEFAVEKQDKELVTLLVEKGANVNLLNEGKYPLDYAKDEEIISLLRSHGAKTTKEIEEEEAKRKAEEEEIAKEAFKQYQIQTILNEDLLTAVQKHAIDIVESLISQGADVNYATMQGNTPLTFAIGVGDMDILKLLLRKGADPHKKNSVLGGGEISAITFARYIVKNERLADFLEYC